MALNVNKWSCLFIHTLPSNYTHPKILPNMPVRGLSHLNMLNARQIKKTWRCEEWCTIISSVSRFWTKSMKTFCSGTLCATETVLSNRYHLCLLCWSCWTSIHTYVFFVSISRVQTMSMGEYVGSTTWAEPQRCHRPFPKRSYIRCSDPEPPIRCREYGWRPETVYKAVKRRAWPDFRVSS